MRPGRNPPSAEDASRKPMRSIIMTANISWTEQKQRILRVFQLQKNLPEVNTETLEKYFAVLTKNFVFPIQGTYDQETGPLQHTTHPVIIKNLSEDIDEFYGIYVEGAAGKKNVEIPLADFDCNTTDQRNFQCIDDYKTWFWNYR
jgi:hypothetical protein